MKKIIISITIFALIFFHFANLSQNSIQAAPGIQKFEQQIKKMEEEGHLVVPKGKKNFKVNDFKDSLINL